MAFPGSIYAPPGVYTQTFYEDPNVGLAASVTLPLVIGTGSEVLVQEGLLLVRGSSSTVDQRIVQEDEAGRAVVSISDAGLVTRGAFDGTLARLQTKHYPIVSGNGTGTTATDASNVSVTVNGDPVVVLAITGATGILKLSVTPEEEDDVRVTYYFNRTDTLITDTLTDQESATGPEIYASVGETYAITEGSNDELSFLVDSSETVEVTLTAGAAMTAADIAANIDAASAAAGSTLAAVTATDNYGNTVLRLTASRDIYVNSASANTAVGLTASTDTDRNKVFYTMQSPVVDGRNEGFASTDPADVTVKVDGVQVIPSALDGQTGAVTLPFAPEVGAVVTCQYYFNSWQDTFDYLAHRNVTDILLCGDTADRSDYLDGADFVLEDDLIVWGSAVLVRAGEHTAGNTYFDDTQIAGMLVDTRFYLAPCTPVTDTSGTPSVENRVDWNLAGFVPTTGNGRSTPLSASTFAEISNNRVDLATNRPDLVYAYWGFNIQDAMDRGRVTVTKVDGLGGTMTLEEPVPVGASVWATFYYNTLQDELYTLSVASEGGSGTGTYTLVNGDGDSVFTPLFVGKSAALATVTIQFPSGSEATPDCRFESPSSATLFTGPVEEDITITFADQDATLAKYTLPGAGPYAIINNASDQFDVEIDGAAITGGEVDLGDPTGHGTGFGGTITGDEIAYDAASGGITYVIDSTNEVVTLQVDTVSGSSNMIRAVAVQGAAQTAADYVTAINVAAMGDFDTSVAGGASTIQLAATSSDVDDYYVGWNIRVTSGVAADDIRTVTGYVAATQTATVGVAWTGAPGVDTYHIYDPDTLPTIASTTRFVSGYTIAVAGEYDSIDFTYTGSVTTGSGVLTATIPGPLAYPTGANLAAAIELAMNTQLAAAGTMSTAAMAAQVTVTADTSGRMVISLLPDATDTNGGFLEFLDSSVAAASDFCIMAGIDTDAAPQGGQAKLVNSQIARRFTIAAPTTGALLNDRIILRNRLIPGSSGSQDGQRVLDQCHLEVVSGTGTAQAGLSSGEKGYAGIRGNVMSPTMGSIVGFPDGQISGAGDATDGMPAITFFGPGGTTAQNNEFKLVWEGNSIPSITFTDILGNAIGTAASADVALGPASVANTVISQIQAAMTAAGLTGFDQEGAGFRLRGTGSTGSSTIVIGDGNANEALGLDEGDMAEITPVETEVLTSALMANGDTGTVADAILDWDVGGGGAGSFTMVALAKTVKNELNAEFLFLQSIANGGTLGTATSIIFDDAAANSVTRHGTGLGVESGDGNTGEAAVEGFTVSSSDTINGSGTADTSLLSGTGAGQDGTVGQTYQDLVTGFTFTVLDREGTAAYPATTTLTFSSRSVVTCDSNLPVNSVPGLELTVSNTTGCAVADTAEVQTYEKGGESPGVGDTYYASYQYTKQDFGPRVFTKLQSVINAYGALNPNNPASLGGYLTLLNGAVVLAVKQVQKDTDSDSDGVLDSASYANWITSVEDIEGSLPGGAYPNILVPMKGDSLDLFNYLARHCDIQSSIRYRAERTCLGGFGAGTQSKTAGDWSQAIARTRLRLVYPDIVTLSLARADGSTDSYLVDGSYLACALAGNRSASSIDVATPWTNTRLFGFDALGRTQDAVEKNQTAVKGLTVIEQAGAVLKVRHGLTTDMSNVLTKTPTVVTIADEVQRQSRATLERFIGLKFLSGITSQIETQLSLTLKSLVALQIIAAYTGVAANTSADDPTVAEVEAFYQPVFPLLYIVITFNLRSSL